MQPQDSTSRLYRAAVITPGVSYRGDGTVSSTRLGVEVDLVTILEATRRRFAAQCTIVIDGPPLSAYSEQSDRVRAAGWQHSQIAAWTLFHDQAGREVALGIRAAFGPPHLGVLFDRDTEPGVIALVLDRYFQVTGTAWRGTFATTALAGIRSTWANERYQPLWNEPRKGPGKAVGPMVWTRELGQWERTWGWVHTFDARSAYLAAAISSDLPFSQLHHVGAQQFDPKLPGYWHLQLDTSTLEMLADPSRPPLLPPARVQDTCAWVTTPYARLLRDSFGDRCEVIDSWTGTEGTRPDGKRGHPAGSRILRTWGGRMRDARTAVEAMPSGPIRDLLLTAVKRTYKDAIGGMQREVNGRGMRVRRGIWAHTIIDQHRATMWRGILRVREKAGVWPVAVKTDSLSYADSSEDPRPLAAELAGARQTAVGAGGLGGWAHEAVVTTEHWEASRKARTR
jgi:hypothetical protein